MISSDRSKAAASWGVTVITVAATLLYQVVVVATSAYVTTAVITVVAALVIWLLFTRKSPHMVAILCILGVCAFIETFGMLVLIVEGVSLGAQCMNFDIVFLTCLSMIAVDGALVAAIFAIQAKKMSSAAFLMPAFGLIALATTIITSLLHSRTT